MSIHRICVKIKHLPRSFSCKIWKDALNGIHVLNNQDMPPQLPLSTSALFIRPRRQLHLDNGLGRNLAQWAKAEGHRIKVRRSVSRPEKQGQQNRSVLVRTKPLYKTKLGAAYLGNSISLLDEFDLNSDFSYTTFHDSMEGGNCLSLLLKPFVQQEVKLRSVVGSSRERCYVSGLLRGGCAAVRHSVSWGLFLLLLLFYLGAQLRREPSA